MCCPFQLGSLQPVAARHAQHIHTTDITQSGRSHPDSQPPPLCDEHAFKLSRAILVSKLSRLQLEQHRRPDLSAVQLERVIRERGTDYDSLLYHHHVHNNFLERVADCFSDAGIDVRIANRYSTHQRSIICNPYIHYTYSHTYVLQP